MACIVHLTNYKLCVTGLHSRLARGNAAALNEGINSADLVPTPWVPGGNILRCRLRWLSCTWMPNLLSPSLWLTPTSFFLLGWQGLVKELSHVAAGTLQTRQMVALLQRRREQIH